MPSQSFMYFLLFWAVVLLLFMSVGGYFMFRKFMKVLPKADGRSKLDWQNHYVDASRHLWTDTSKAFLEKLVSPVPGPFRDIARHSIAAKIGEVALEKGVSEVTEQICIEGYILATPKRDHKSLITFLEKHGIDYSPYQHLLN
ncbi:DUF2621 domain-containing protein [Paenibacillus ginsengarvi]|uniref:DUF2621 domain-containing protein n=1 Tax=Paenibacillus ginsengarvi TaxID=400777 RepID=A0A3B0CAI3_9BACL|nr:DUF2621 domain-containing protein [Paenibacillus ginsengarvi]RKN82140.1 DUF2621 domain-containing protein [Paenibacillus ginsengarvi]